MTKQEFIDKVGEVLACKKLDVEFEVSDNDYKTIEFVYMHHPAISEVEGKFQIASLYVDFGMVLINDMVPRARLMSEKEAQYRNIRLSLDRLGNEMSEIRNGASLDLF